MHIDKEYAMLEMLSENEELSQRQLSKLLDISLGSVNMLINKMQKEGLIKFKSISANSIAYMLTPEGIAEKAKKTYRYVTYHYKRINDTKEKIKNYLENKSEEEQKMYLILDDSEMSQIILLAISEMKNCDKIEALNDKKGNIDNYINDKALFILLKSDDMEKYKGCRAEAVLEMI